MSKYFASSSSSKRGELQEWKEELHASDKSTQKEAVKKVIAAMTVGKDVSCLFPDVVQCMQSSSIELKKLVYLYISNYARMQPELAILAVNTFRKDATDPSSPLIRALAVRTMGCIKLPAILEYLLEPVQRACVDADPYVRKTAATCIAKIHQLDATVCQEQGLLDALLEMIGDANPVVVCNALASILEISDSLLLLDHSTLQRLLAALNEATEWGQITILDALAVLPMAASAPAAGSASELVLERVLPRLNHSNPAVVLSAVKVVLRFGGSSGNSGGKLAGPLVSLMASEPEVQYVALRALSLVTQHQAAASGGAALVLRPHAKSFFVKYNDPLYVKLEKLEMLVLLADESNVELILSECREYCGEIDIEFVRRAIRSIGKIAIKLNSAAMASRATHVLFGLAGPTAPAYILEETAIVLRDVFRKFSLAFETVLATLCANLHKIETPEGKSAVIFLLGEYAEHIANVHEIFNAYCEYFVYESVAVQLALLTAAVKFFLKVPGTGQSVVTHVLKLATGAAAVDVRERAYMYWRMLSSDPERCKAVVLGDKPLIQFENVLLDKELVAKLVGQLGLVSSVVHKLPAQFLVSAKRTSAAGPEEDEHENEEERKARMQNLKVATEKALAGNLVLAADRTDLLDGGSSDATPLPAVVVSRTTLGAQNKTAGVEVAACIYADLRMLLRMGNFTNSPLQAVAVQTNKNFFGLAPANASLGGMSAVQMGEYGETDVVICFNQNMLTDKTNMVPPAFPLGLQVALKTSADVFYFTVPVRVCDVLRKHAAAAVSGEGEIQVIPSSRHWSGEALGETLSSLNLAYAGMQDHVALFGAKTIAGTDLGVRVHLGEPLRIQVASLDPLLTAFIYDVLTQTLA